MSEFFEGKLSTLARRLEPYVRKWVREILGENDGKSVGNITYIHGTGFPKLDELGTRGQKNVGGDKDYRYSDFQLNRDNDDEVVGGEFGYILGGVANKTYWKADSVIGGRGGYIVDNESWVMGNYFSTPGDGQTHWMIMFGEEYYYPSENWGPLYSYALEDHANHTMLFNAYFAGHDVIDGSKCWHFMLDAVVTWNGTGTLSIVWQRSTEIYSSGDGVDVRIGAGYGDGITYEAYSDCYQGIRWFVHARISEISF